MEGSIAFASRNFNKAEVNYEILHKQPIILAVQKFYQYLIDNDFTLVTDHKLLLIIFGQHLNIKLSKLNRFK